MPEQAIDVTARWAYETDSHLTGARITRGSGEWTEPEAPGRMIWAEIHDTTLPARFKTALEQLERLCYAVFGSRPQQYTPTFKDWWHRVHPRCLWGPEQWEQVWCPNGPPPACTEYHWRWHEYAALGQCLYCPQPTVPIRSRSGDWRRQMIEAAGDRLYFPIGSVERDNGSQTTAFGGDFKVPLAGSDYVFDPLGAGHFGGDPAHVGTDGDVEVAGEDVEVRYTPPAALAALVQSATLYWNGVAVPMTLDGGIWNGTIPAQLHDTQVLWHIAVLFQAPGEPAYTRHEPGGENVPDDAHRYSFTCYTHWNPYPHGLPELWSKCKKGTDEYRFDPTECIQPELINLARFVLDDLAGRFQHSPKTRAELPGCCLDLPIKFRWSGSAPWPIYLRNGKAGVDGVRPLHNLDDGAGDLSARRTWRGVDEEWAGHPAWPNPEYGSGVSWEPIPFEPRLEQWDYEGPEDCRIYWTGAHRGLQLGDVIDAVHLEEIIAAVNYLVDGGLWLLQPVRQRPMTPTEEIWGGLACGYWTHVDAPNNVDDSGWHTTLACCQNPYPADPEDCDHYPAPASWDACWHSQDPDSPCWVAVINDRHCWLYPDDLMGDSLSRSIDCSVAATISGDSVYAQSSELNAQQYRYVDCNRHRLGWWGFICGPIINPGGPHYELGVDVVHGNSLTKRRWTHDCWPFEKTLLNMGRSAGNHLEEVFTCETPAEGYNAVDFETVTAVKFPGFGDPWLAWDCEIVACEDGYDYECWWLSSGEVPAIPGFPDYRYWNKPDGSLGDMYCATTCVPAAYTPGAHSGSLTCGFSLPTACSGTQVYTCICLYLDMNGMVTLRDYEPDPGAYYEPWLTECPCETETGAVSCQPA